MAGEIPPFFIDFFQILWYNKYRRKEAIQMDWFIFLMILIAGIVYIIAPIILIIMTPFVVYELIVDMVSLWHYYRLERKMRRRR